jgi:hypothetical protein
MRYLLGAAIALAAALWLSPRTLRAQPAEARTAALADPALAAVRAELATVLADLARDGLPEELVIRKVREGLAKRVAPERILVAARGTAINIRLIARVNRKHLPPRDAFGRAMIRAAVGAHQAGVPLAAVDKIVKAVAPRGPVTTVTALRTATDLVTAGYPSGRSVELVLLVAARDRADDELPRAVAVLEAAHRARGESRADTLDRVARAVGDGRDLAAAAAELAGGRGGAHTTKPGAGAGRLD